MVTKFEAKKHGYRQTKDGVVVSFVLHPNDVDAALAAAPLGTMYALGIVEVEAGISPQPDEVVEVEAAVSVDLATPAAQWINIPYTQQAGIRCNDPEFMHWIGATTASEAADRVRAHCKVGSRKHLVRGTQAGEQWAALDVSYQAYLTSKQYAGYRR